MQHNLSNVILIYLGIFEIFLCTLIKNLMFAYKQGGWVKKRPKICLRNIWMVPYCRRVQNLKLSLEPLVPAQVKCRSNAVGNHKFHPESQTQLCLAADIDNLLGAIIFCNFFGFNPLNTILATFLFQHVLKLIRRSSYFIFAVCHDLPISIF